MANTQAERVINLINNLYQNSRYSNNDMGKFIYFIFSSDLCLGLKNYPTYVSSDFDYYECINIYDGIYTKGYIQFMQAMLDMFSNYF